MEVQVRVVFEAQGRFDNDCLYQRQIKASNREDFLPFIDMHAHAHTNTLQALVCESSGTAQVVHFIKMLQQRTSFVSLGLCSLVSSSKETMHQFLAFCHCLMARKKSSKSLLRADCEEPLHPSVFNCYSWTHSKITFQESVDFTILVATYKRL